MKRRRKPRVPLTDPAFRYVPAASTCVATTLERFGFVGPEEQRRRAARARVIANVEPLTPIAEPSPVLTAALGNVRAIVDAGMKPKRKGEGNA